MTMETPFGAFAGRRQFLPPTGSQPHLAYPPMQVTWGGRALQHSSCSPWLQLACDDADTTVGNMLPVVGVVTSFGFNKHWKGISLNAKTRVRLFVAPNLIVFKFTLFEIFDSLQVYRKPFEDQVCT